MGGRKVHLVFKTHLDIGFTDLAAKVRRLYHERFIPSALDTGEHFHAESPDQKMFVWTTGAWLIWDYLNSQPQDRVRRLERAIERGLIRWHALPFTTHSELMSPALFRAGLSFSRELDQRFGTTTIAAKMTDVPGHTLGIVPLLAEAGVRFLHIGVNAASTPPDVPDIFRWQAPEGEEVVVIYQRCYGDTFFPQGLDVGLSFAHTGDNVGPQSVSQAVECHRAMRAANPGTAIQASTLEDFGELVWRERNRFAVVDAEIADSWIHGSASDPDKTARFLALQRLYDRFTEEGLDARRLAFGRGLTLVAEHTCGVDIKTYLRDDTSWDRPAFEAARKTDFRFSFVESSWAEQRAYLDAAVANLADRDQQRAVEVLDALRPFIPDDQRVADSLCERFEVGGWEVEYDTDSGSLTQLIPPNGPAIEASDDSLLAYRYESYDASDVNDHMQSYLSNWQEWAILDHGKPGLEGATAARSAVFDTTLVDVLRWRGNLVLRLACPDVAHRELGAPRYVDLLIQPRSAGGLTVTVALRDKPANRMPEASFVSFQPAGITTCFSHKLGVHQPADRVVVDGGGQLQAVSAVDLLLGDRRRFSIAPLDTPLVAPAGQPFMRFSRQPPDFSRGVRFNLHNNKWGTNFPMWWEGTFQARFDLALHSAMP